MFEESPVQVLSYPLEAALAEKLETSHEYRRG